MGPERLHFYELTGDVDDSGLQNSLLVAEPPRTWRGPQVEGGHPGYTWPESVLVGHSQCCMGF